MIEQYEKKSKKEIVNFEKRHEERMTFQSSFVKYGDAQEMSNQVNFCSGLRRFAHAKIDKI